MLSYSSSAGRTSSLDDLIERRRRTPAIARAGADSRGCARQATGAPAPPSASTQRSQMPAQSGSVRTLGTNRQQRAHFTPGAFSTSTRTSSAPSAAPTLSVDVRDDEEHRQLARDAARAARRSARCAVTTTRAPSELPMTLSLRFSSSAALTVSRTSSRRVPASRRARDPRSGRPSGKSSRCTDAERGPGQVAPELVGGDRQDRRQQPRQAVADQVHRRLRRAPLAASAAPSVYIRSFVTST